MCIQHLQPREDLLLVHMSEKTNGISFIILYQICVRAKKVNEGHLLGRTWLIPPSLFAVSLNFVPNVF